MLPIHLRLPSHLRPGRLPRLRAAAVKGAEMPGFPSGGWPRHRAARIDRLFAVLLGMLALGLDVLVLGVVIGAAGSAVGTCILVGMTLQLLVVRGFPARTEATSPVTRLSARLRLACRVFVLACRVFVALGVALEFHLVTVLSVNAAARLPHRRRGAGATARASERTLSARGHATGTAAEQAAIVAGYGGSDTETAWSAALARAPRPHPRQRCAAGQPCANREHDIGRCRLSAMPVPERARRQEGPPCLRSHPGPRVTIVPCASRHGRVLHERPGCRCVRDPRSGDEQRERERDLRQIRGLPAQSPPARAGTVEATTAAAGKTPRGPFVGCPSRQPQPSCAAKTPIA